MNVWLSSKNTKSKDVSHLKIEWAEIVKDPEFEKNEQIWLEAHADKLSTHNAIHRNSIVFWSCSKCHASNSPQIMPCILDDKVSFKDHIRSSIERYKAIEDNKDAVDSDYKIALCKPDDHWLLK